MLVILASLATSGILLLRRRLAGWRRNSGKIRQSLVQPRAWSISTYNQKKINRNSFKLFFDTLRPKTKNRARSSAQQKCCAWGLRKNVIQIRRKWAKTGLCDNNQQCYVPIFIVNCFYYFQLAKEKFPVLQDWHKLICLKSQLNCKLEPCPSAK